MPAHQTRRDQLAGRRGYSLIELLLAALVTSFVAAAGATMTSAISNAAVQTRDIRSTKTAGNFALSRVGRAIREARSVGQVTSTSVTLWVQDSNGDDQLNLYEVAMLRYDSTAKQIIYEYLDPGANPKPATTMTTANFKNSTTVQSLMTSPDRKSEVWAEGVQSLTFTGYPSYTETRIVQTQFVVGTGPDETSFAAAASPRASADYLFKSGATQAPLPNSARPRRKHYSRWDGYGDVSGSSYYQIN